MNFLFQLILVLHVLVCLVLVASILVQQGKGATMGAAFGTAGSQTVFGSAGAGNFLTKTTSVCAVIFFSTSLLLAYRGSFRRSVVADIPEAVDTTPVPSPAVPKPEGSADAPKGAGPAAPTDAKAVPAAPTAAPSDAKSGADAPSKK